MNNYNLEILDYVSKRAGSWSDTTISTAYSKLCTVASIGWDNPDTVFSVLNGRGYSRYTIQTYFTVAQEFERETRATRRFEEWIKNNRLQFKNCYKEKTRRITHPAYEMMLKNAASTTHYNFLLLTGKFGLRRSEALSARWEDFHEGRLVVVGKGNKQRILPRQFGQELLKDRKETGLIIPQPFRINFLSPFSPHDLRHYAVTSWVNDKKLNLKEAAVLAGHASTATTSRYIRTDLTEIEEKLNDNGN